MESPGQGRHAMELRDEGEINIRVSHLVCIKITTIAMKPRPDRIYRYMNTATAWECLKESTLAFTPPFRFNDPFDTNIAVDPVVTADDIREFYPKCAAVCPDGPTEDQVVEAYLKDPALVRNFMAKARDNFMRNSIGVACFTELRPDAMNAPLMWAHYADRHHGVVLGFETAHPNLLDIEPVDYSGDRPVHRKLGGKLDGKQYMKSKVWGYEQEWRLNATLHQCEVRMIAQTPIYVQTLSRDSFASITFGCRTPPEFKTAVALSLKQWSLAHCKVQEMQLCDLTYELTPKEFII